MKRILITGASDGLGKAIAEELIEKNIETVNISRSNLDNKIKHIKADLSKEEDIEESIKYIKKEYPNFDCLINCAGIYSEKDLDSIDYKEIDKLFKINVLAPIKLVSGLLDNIKKSEADIVNIGSTIGFKAYEKQGAYGSSKWAIRGFSENLRLELKNTKSRIISFNPGGIKTKLAEKATGEKINLEGFMEPKDLAKLVVQLLELPKNIEVSEIVINRKK